MGSNDGDRSDLDPSDSCHSSQDQSRSGSADNNVSHDNDDEEELLLDEDEVLMDPEMINEVDADQDADAMALRVGQTMVDFSNGMEIQQLNEKYNSLLMEFEVYQSSTDTVLNVLKVSNKDLERQYKSLKEELKKQRQNQQIKAVSKPHSKYSSRRSSRRSSFEDAQSRKSESIGKVSNSESTSHHLDSTVFLTMFNNMHQEIEQRFQRYHEILKGRDKSTALQITLQKMEKRLDLNIQNILHALAAKTDNNQFELTIDSLVSKINAQFFKLSKQQEEREKQQKLNEKHREQLNVPSEDLALSDVISEVNTAPETRRNSGLGSSGLPQIGPIPDDQQQTAGPTMPAMIKRTSLKETVMFMRFSSKLSKKADVSQFYTLQQEIYDIQSVLKKMDITRSHLATTIHQHDRDLKQLKHARPSHGRPDMSRAISSKHGRGGGGGEMKKEQSQGDLHGSADSMERINLLMKSHKVWITRNSDDITSVRKKYMKIHDLLEKLKQFAGIDDENEENLTVINAPLSVRAASPIRSKSPLRMIRSKSPSRSHNVLDLSQSPSRQLLQSRGGMRSSHGLTSDDLIQEQLDVLALELETKADKGDLRKKVSRGEMKKNLKELAIEGQISDNAYFSGRPLEFWKCISCDRPTKLRQEQESNFQFPQFPITSKSRVQFNRTKTPPAFFRHGSPSPNAKKMMNSRYGKLPPLGKQNGKDETTRERPKTSPFVGGKEEVDQDKMTPKGGIVRVPDGTNIQRPITRQTARATKSGELMSGVDDPQHDADEREIV